MLFGGFSEGCALLRLDLVNLGQQNRLALHPQSSGTVFCGTLCVTLRGVVRGACVSSLFVKTPVVVATLVSSMAGLFEKSEIFSRK